MLWKKAWSTESVLLLLGGIVLSLFSGNLAVELFRRLQVVGFQTTEAVGSVLVATLSLHGAAIVLGTFFLKMNELTWREALGLNDPNWKRHLLLAVGVLGTILPWMFVLKMLSELLMKKLGWKVEDQDAVELFFNIKSTGLRIYMAFFAIILAPFAEEFIFRGILFSWGKKLGWPRCGAMGASLLFALIHANAPIFLPLLLFALALTWLYQKTEGLIAPMFAHALFNGANLILLVLAGKLGATLHS